MGNMLTAVMQRLEALERRLGTTQQPQELSLQTVNSVPLVEKQSAVPRAHVAVSESLTTEELPTSEAKPRQREPQADWLTVRELHQGLKQRGFTKSDTTMRRLLKEARGTGELPTELIELGVEADFKSRNEAKPRDNTVKWLRLR